MTHDIVCKNTLHLSLPRVPPSPSQFGLRPRLGERAAGRDEESPAAPRAFRPGPILL